jgi:3-oxoacyl-[acyl-carrier protein] reductase
MTAPTSHLAAGVPQLLPGKTAIVTGAAQGIGLAIAQTLADAGARVVLSDRDEQQLKQAADGLTDQGRDVLAVRCDVTVEADVDNLVARCLDAFGRLDVMVNNAGITRDATMRKMAIEDFRAVVDVHLLGSWLGCRAAARVMREQGSGSVVNISSLSGKIGNIGQTNYSAAKAGIIGLTKAAAKEVAHAGVRVNAIQPGLITTGMTAAMRPSIWQSRLDAIPMGRAGDPAEVASVVLFLASDLASYLTGAVLEVTGGRDM